jgi:hypothetical protein
MLNKLELIKECISLCHDSYNNNKITFSNNCAAGFSIIKDNILYVIIRGTDDLRDVFLDLNIKKTDLIISLHDKSYGKVASGFYSYYKLLSETINELVYNYIYDGGKNIVFTGHSLGASVVFSALETQIIYKNKNININCFTFGSPKLGDKILKNNLNKILKNYYRISNDNDLITKLPFRCDYFHAGKNIKLKSNVKLNLYDFIYGIYLFLRQKKITNNNVIYNHYTDEYMILINEQLK